MSIKTEPQTEWQLRVAWLEEEVSELKRRVKALEDQNLNTRLDRLERVEARLIRAGFLTDTRP